MPKTRKERDRDRHLLLVDKVRQLKKKPCLDCGLEYPFYVMDFDHRKGEIKQFELSSVSRRHMGLKRILAEIAKCDLVCANCHRIRSYNRMKEKNAN